MEEQQLKALLKLLEESSKFVPKQYYEITGAKSVIWMTIF
jgi:hypothetical protein